MAARTTKSHLYVSRRLIVVAAKEFRALSSVAAVKVGWDEFAKMGEIDTKRLTQKNN